MANTINMNSFRKLSYFSTFETRSLNAIELMEGIFGPPPINPLNIEDSNNNENWPRFDTFSDDNFTVNYPFVPCILANVDAKPTGVLKTVSWPH